MEVEAVAYALSRFGGLGLHNIYIIYCYASVLVVIVTVITLKTD